jgi:predicted ATPase
MSFTLLSLRDFKCHAALDLPLAPFTILTGLNSAGKSTVCHAFALLGQSIREARDSSRGSLLLNGDLVRLGTVGDVRNQTTDHALFEISLRDEVRELTWRFEGERRASQANLADCTLRLLDGSRDATYSTLSPDDPDAAPLVDRLRELVYVTILRNDPSEIPRVTGSESELRIGTLGDGAVALLHFRDQARVSESLCIENVPPTLPRQVEAWMSHFFPGFAMDIQPADGSMEILTLRIRTDISGEFHLPSNVGYGPYYVLPIITAALSAKPGGFLMLDSPEAHLHPRCQNEMARFLTKVAATGVQILVETHNDHFVNGARQAVKEGALDPASTIIHYFGESTDDGAHRHSTVLVDREGSLDHWPRGFCDQYEIDLASLTEWE